MMSKSKRTIIKIVFPGVLIVTGFFIIAPLFSAYRGPVVKEDENNASASSVSLRHVVNEKYVIDKKESVVTWKGSKVFAPEEAHIGNVYISKGELTIEKGQLVGGTVEIDMNTITDPVHGSDNNLINHLKDPDFFDVKKFPVSTFAITKVASVNSENIKVTGNLTIKGITREVIFPVEIEVNGGIINANGKVIIDRTQWDIRYRSGRFYENLADKTISDDIEFKMKIVAKK
jgi:polyisoprenoid-binding protein YceI